MRTAPRAARAGAPYWLAFAFVLQSAALGYLAFAISRVEHALDRPPPAATPAETPRAHEPSNAAPAPAAAAPSVANLGEGRIVYASADGKLLVLHRDPVSNELLIDRVYAVEKDDLRNAGDDARRAYSGFYLVDVERARREEVSVQDGLFKDAVAKAPDRPDGLDRAIAVARRLVAAGGVDRLRSRLEDRNNFARHAASIALGESGYLAAVPDLIQIVEGIPDTELARHAAQLLRELTGLAIEPDDPRPSVVRQADEWWRKNAPEDPFARRVPPPR